MQGIIFKLLEQFIFSLFSGEIWKEAVLDTGSPELAIDSDTAYPDELFESMVEKLIKRSGMIREEFLTSFGKFLAPTLIDIYQPKQSLGLLGVLITAEETLHKTIRKNLIESEPIRFSVIRISEKRAEIIYASRLNMPETAIGIIQGLGEYLKEKTVIEHHELADGNHLITVETF